MWTPSYCWYWPKVKPGGTADLHFSPTISNKHLWRSRGRPASSPKWIRCELREPFSFYNKAQLYKGFTIFPIWNVCDSLSCAVLWKCCRLRDHFTLMFNLIEYVSLEIKARGRASPSSCAQTPSHVLFSLIILLNASSVTTTHITLPDFKVSQVHFIFFQRHKWFTSFSFVCPLFLPWIKSYKEQNCVFMFDFSPRSSCAEPALFHLFVFMLIIQQIHVFH